MMKNTYNEMKDSGFNWLGRIPIHWQLTDIGSLYTQRNERVSDKDYEPLSVTKKGILPQLSTVAKTDDGDNRKLVKSGDFVINSRSDRRGSCGISPCDGSVSLINTVLSPRGKMHPDYFDWLFHTESFADEFYKWGHGIVDDLWTTRWSEMKQIVIPIPEFMTQTAIAAYLDEKCGTIDEIIAEAKASIEEYKAWKSSVIFEAVTKGLDPNTEMKDSGVEWMGDIPKHWKCVPMKYLLQERNQKNDPIVTSERLSLSIDIGVTLYAEKTTNLDRFKEDVSQYKVAHAGDLVLNSMNMIVGAVGIAPVLGCVSPAYYIFYDNNPKHTSARFCNYIFKNKRLRGCLFSLGQGIMAIDRGDGRINTCRLKVSRDDLGRIMLPCPPEDEQEKIITYLDNRFAAIDGIIAEKEALIADMEAYKKSLIFETVTGKRKVC